MKMKIERTKKNYPAFWESGGGFSNTGTAMVVADSDGNPKPCLYKRRSGKLANSRHALVLLELGDFIIKSSHHRLDFTIEIFRVVEIREDTAEVELLYEFSNGEWNIEPPEFLKTAIQKSKEKADCYHCREPHFVMTYG